MNPLAWQWLSIAFLLLVWACENNRVEQVSAVSIVARLGQKEISIDDFDRMAAKLLSGPYHDLEVIDDTARTVLLEAMIAKYLLVEEAENRGLGGDAEIVGKLEALETDLLSKALYERRAITPLTLSEEEIQTLFHQGGYAEEVRFSHVMCATAAEAHRVLLDLEKGMSFAGLAAERSIHRDTARRQGDMGFVPMASMLSEVKDAVLRLKIGEVSRRPVQSRYGFHVFKLTGRRTVALEDRREIVERQLQLDKRNEQIAAYREQLKQNYKLECSVAPLVGDPGSNTKMCGWSGGSLSVDQYLKARSDSTLPDSSALIAALEKMAMERIVRSEARRLSLDQEASVVESMQRRREELLIKRLQKRVTAQVAIEQRQVQGYFDDHPNLYGPRNTVLIQEILVADADTAQQLYRRIAKGEDMAVLAAQYHIRQETRDRGGKMWLRTRKNALLGPLTPLALDAPVGTLHGPLEVPGGYSIFRVEKREQLPAKRLEDVQRSIQLLLEIQAKNEAMETLLAELRTKRNDELKIFSEALKHTLKEEDLGTSSNVSPAVDMRRSKLRDIGPEVRK